jgi:hypothetical protein
MLRSDGDRRADASAATGINEGDILAWAHDGTCGTTSAALLPHLQSTTTDPPQFSVGFTSVAAGTLLAAELVKTLLGTGQPLDKALPRAVLQFFNPASPHNGAVHYARDPQCPKCDPNTFATRYWQERTTATVQKGGTPR